MECGYIFDALYSFEYELNGDQVMFDFDQYAIPEGTNTEDYVVATYLFRSRLKDMLKQAALMATEQTTGTWIGVPGETRDLMEVHRGKVLAIWEVPDYETG